MLASNPLIALAKFLLFSAIVRLIPERKWLNISRFLGRVSASFRRTFGLQDIKHVVGLLGRTLTPEEVRKIETGRPANAYLNGLLTMGQRVSKGRRQNIRVLGLENIATALSAGKGVILWVSPFSYASLIAKMGLSQAGIEVSHLSQDRHGFGKSKLALRYLNPRWVYCENLYLKERLVMTAASKTGALRALRRCLRANGVVSITLGDRGEQQHSVPFLNGTLPVATGALGLATSTGAKVLPVYTLRDSEGNFEVRIEPPLESGPDSSRVAQFDHMLTGMTESLAPLVAQNPEQWNNWEMFRSSD